MRIAYEFLRMIAVSLPGLVMPRFENGELSVFTLRKRMDVLLHDLAQV